MDIVLKFGGTSLGTPEALRRSATIVADTVRAGHHPAVVVSALANERGRATKKLEDGAYDWVVGEYRALAEALGVSPPLALFSELRHLVGNFGCQLSGSPGLLNAREEIIGFGERLMAVVFANYLLQLNVHPQPVDAREFVVVASDRAVLVDETRVRVASYFKNFAYLPVVTGYIARTLDGSTVTIGRGGSDLTAVLVAHGVGAREVELWSDVSGIMTADPRLVESAYPVGAMTYDEALQAVRAGAKGIPPEAILYAKRNGIAISVRNSSDPLHPGTHIGGGSPFGMRGPRLVAYNDKLAIIEIASDAFAGVAGTAARITGVLANDFVNLVAFAQAAPEHSVSLVVAHGDAVRACASLAALFLDASVSVSEPIPCAMLTIVGESMCGVIGTSGRLYHALGRAGANVRFAAQAQEHAISVAVSCDDGPAALCAAHVEFFEHTGAPAIFLLGVGTIGGALLAAMGGQKLPSSAHLCGVANSRKMAVVPQGIAPERAWELLGDSAEAFRLDEFLARARRVPAMQRVIVDCTASPDVAGRYPDFFRQGFDVVAANKLANSAPLDQYLAMLSVLRDSGRSFRDTANVGGKLGVIPMIRRYGPKITRVEAILSGTLGWLFSHYDGTRSFAELLGDAQRLGLTEPDPQKDLSGEDVVRKLLILLRKLDCHVDFADIRPRVCDLRGRDEEYFLGFLKEAAEWPLREPRLLGGRARYVAAFASNGHAGAGLTTVGLDSPFYSANNAENVVVIYTTTEPPIVLRGPGAGAEVTAEAVLLDIIEVLNA